MHINEFHCHNPIDRVKIFLFRYVIFADIQKFSPALFRVTALLITSRGMNRKLLHDICWSAVQLFSEASMQSTIACWEWLLAARTDLSDAVSGCWLRGLTSVTR